MSIAELSDELMMTENSLNFLDIGLVGLNLQCRLAGPAFAETLLFCLQIVLLGCCLGINC